MKKNKSNQAENADDEEFKSKLTPLGTITPQQLVGNYVTDGVLANAQDNLQGNGIEWRMAA